MQPGCCAQHANAVQLVLLKSLAESSEDIVGDLFDNGILTA